MLKETLEQRLWAKAGKKGPDECWEWQAYKNPGGYGTIGYKRTVLLAHRVAWELTNGSIPNEQCVLHRCDNPSCVNPAHLFLGTLADNNADMERKGRCRKARGEASGGAKLTREQVLEIRDDPRTQRALGRIYGVEHSTIGCIKRRVKWAWL